MTVKEVERDSSCSDIEDEKQSKTKTVVTGEFA
jgi:hypothetical protein